MARIGCIVLVVVGLILGVMAFSTYNRLVGLEENVNASWSQVQNAYQRRADLIPNLVRTVEAAAKFERETLTAVTEARSRASAMQLTPELLSDPEAFAKFEAAQSQLSSALSRLLVTVEAYPDLKSNQNFLQLQDELAGTENRISTERMRFNETAQTYNTARRRFPAVFLANLMGFREKAYFKATEGAERPPEVKFQ